MLGHRQQGVRDAADAGGDREVERLHGEEERLQRELALLLTASSMSETVPLFIHSVASFPDPWNIRSNDELCVYDRLPTALQSSKKQPHRSLFGRMFRRQRSDKGEEETVTAIEFTLTRDAIAHLYTILHPVDAWMLHMVCKATWTTFHQMMGGRYGKQVLINCRTGYYANKPNPFTTKKLPYSKSKMRHMNRHSSAINQLIRDDRERLSRLIVIPVFGGQLSGKDCMLKSIRVNTTGDYTEEELTSYTRVVHHNAIEGMQQLISAADAFGYCMSTENVPIAEQLRALELTLDNVALSGGLGHSVQRLYKDDAIVRTVQRRFELHINDCVYHFLDDIERLSKEDYVPSQRDFTRVRVRRSVICEHRFGMNGHAFTLMDAAAEGVASAGKWVSHFESATVVLFAASTVSYARSTSVGGDAVNGLQQDLQLFTEVVNNPYLTHLPIVLMLTKVEQFEEVLQRYPLDKVFPDECKDLRDVPTAFVFIEDKFKSVIRVQRSVYVYRTCEYNEDNMGKIWAAVRDSGIRAMLQGVGIIPFGAQ